jgi:predicted RNA-binding Zn-ribbon protein involved in translation (DUF1610 family)
MKKFNCPECNSPVEFYETSRDEKSGKYKCPNCGRDTIWTELRVYSVFDVINKIKKAKNNDQQKSE